jgi:hypothetical protein
MANEDHSELKQALDREDLLSVVQIADGEQIKRLVSAEELFEKRYQRRKRSSTIAAASQAVVGYVALAGFFANAYQNWNNKKQQEEQAKLDNARWEREFKRAQDADKYRAFFETSALVTDAKNPDKRLVGYALLKEFVDDKDYNSKATLMLEESLAQELRNEGGDGGLDEAHRNAVVAILSALSHTTDCKALERAARTIDKLARHHAKTGDVEGVREAFGIYVRRLVGRAADGCPNPKDFKSVRKPLRDTLMKLPELGGLSGKVTPAAAIERIAEILRDHCVEEIGSTGVTDCPEIWRGYDKICTSAEKNDPKVYKDEAAGCALMRASAPPPPAAPDASGTSSAARPSPPAP